MVIDERWKRILAELLGWAYSAWLYHDYIFLVNVWSVIPDEYGLDDETYMRLTLELLRHCLEEGYLVAGKTFRVGPPTPEPPPGLSVVEKAKWIFAHSPKETYIDWRPWDMGYSEAVEKIRREWQAIDKPFEAPEAMYSIVALVPTAKGLREYERLRKELHLDEEEGDKFEAPSSS
jgi:hypothetical protein